LKRFTTAHQKSYEQDGYVLLPKFFSAAEAALVYETANNDAVLKSRIVDRGDRDGFRTRLTLWYSLYAEPETVPSAVGPMIRIALIIFVVELIVIGWVRMRQRQGSRVSGELSGTKPTATRA